MSFLLAAAALIIIAAVLKWWMGINLEEGFLGKGLMLIVVVLVIVGLLAVFGILPFRGWASGISGAAFASVPASAATDLQPVLTR